MIDVHTAYHGWFLKEWHGVYGPRFSSDFGTNLNQDFIAYTSDILALNNRIAQHNLGRNWYLMDK